ncbi:MAG: DUF971 domain-containing protein [Bdellovibrionia bacterium]
MSFSTPTRIEPLSPIELHVQWNTGESYSVPYAELRFLCPCAGCVDEHTGQRTIQKTSIAADVRPLNAQPVGRYAIQITWNDGHSTGIYHFDKLFSICQNHGKPLNTAHSSSSEKKI